MNGFLTDQPSQAALAAILLRLIAKFLVARRATAKTQFPLA